MKVFLAAPTDTAKNLKTFQEVKFTHMFNTWFNPQKDTITMSNITDWVEKIRVHSSLSKEHVTNTRNLDVFTVLFESCVDQARQEKDSIAANVSRTWDEARAELPKRINEEITVETWLNMWGKLMHGSAGMKDLPSYIQGIPDILFDAMDLDKNGQINREELGQFFISFFGLKHKEMEFIVEKIYVIMTLNGDAILNRREYNHIFANFLLCQSQIGSGQYIFGPIEGKLSNMELLWQGK